MNYEYFQKKIAAEGFFSELRTPSHFESLVCAEFYYSSTETEPNGSFNGITFQVREDEIGWSIAFWSARTWRCPNGEACISLALDLLSGKYIASGKTPSVMPPELIQRYQLKEML